MLKLLPHQEKNFRRIVEQKRVIDASEMGTGKSVTALTAIDYAIRHNETKKAMIIVPAFLIKNWMNECEKFYPELKICHVKRGSFDYQSHIYIASYESLKWMWDVAQLCNFWVVDECHYLSNPKAQRTCWFMTYLKQIEPTRVLLLSGTILKNRISDLYVPLRICDRSVAKAYPSQFRFNLEYMNYNEIMINGRKIARFEGHRNLHKLKQLLGKNWFRVLIDDCIDLPAFKMSYLRYDFDDCVMPVIGGVDPESHISKKKAQSALVKSEFTSEFVQSMLNQGVSPILVFSDHVKSVENIANKLKARVSTITGATPPMERGRLVELFQQGHLDALVCTIGAASVGLTLTRANVCVFNDLSWVPANNSQARGRIRRVGQDRQCLYYVVTGSSVDESISKQLIEKDEISSLVYGE